MLLSAIVDATARGTVARNSAVSLARVAGVALGGQAREEGGQLCWHRGKRW